MADIAEALLADLLADALRGVAVETDRQDGRCWCPGGPEVGRHTIYCERARSALVALAEARRKP